jgi:hypothetical protein
MLRMTYVIITESKHGHTMYFREQIAGQNARSEWLLTKEAATRYDDYYIAAAKISRCFSWVEYATRKAFAYPRVVDASDVEDHGSGCGEDTLQRS